MQEKPTLVSIIIPAFNAAAFIQDTINSIFTQTYANWEVLIINDGSTDETPAIIKRFSDPRVKYIDQPNSGVAAARNNGLKQVKGEYIVFFDADDLMTPEFLSARINVLQDNPAIGYAGGLVQTFPVIEQNRRAVASDPVNEILFFNSSFVTVPSNYIFRRSVLADNRIVFNNKLSSSADRFFILEVSQYTKGANVSDDTGRLLYRYNSQSMSHKVTPGLIIDNERFYYELKKKNLLPEGKKQKFKSFYFFSLAIGFGMVHSWKRVIKYTMMSFVNHPLFFTKSFGRRIIYFPYFRSLRIKEA